MLAQLVKEIPTGTVGIVLNNIMIGSGNSVCEAKSNINMDSKHSIDITKPQYKVIGETEVGD